MADETLLTLAKDVRGKTLRLLNGVAEEQARWTPPGLQNHLLWHAGHALVVVENLTFSPPSLPAQPPRHPQEWFDLFSWDSKPTPETRYPSLADVVAQLGLQLERVLVHVHRLDDVALTPTIVHAFHDEACHQGEIHLLKKLYARR